VTYVKFHESWENEPSTDTPITAEALDHIEEGIQDAHDAIDAIVLEAENVTIADAAGDFTATTVEGALAEIQTDVEALSARDLAIPWQIVFGAQAAESPTASFATFDVRGNGHVVLDFDASTDEYMWFRGFLPAGYAGGGVNVTLIWAATSATSGNVVWATSFEAIHVGGHDIDAEAIGTVMFATAATDSVSGDTTATTIAHAHGAEMDSPAAGSMFRLKVMRDANDGADTMTGDAELLMVVITEQ
jgi:hypothetical protein